MNSHNAYEEMIQRSYNRAWQEGSRPFPVASFEIMLLSHARKQAAEKEKALFLRLNHIFNWDLNRRQQNQYLHQMENGATLILTDTARTILWASHSILAMTGYSAREVLGKTPRLFQGTGTSPLVTDHIRQNLRNASPVSVELTNYRKNGEAYQCIINIDPLHNQEGDLTHFLAVERETTH
ncbi:PAS domain-containing protein [Arsenicibacter rosenii]|uniref:Histidine kinase n=1 Tax=Arsenicibacter rosenii TaxID=1750698 RepID=A0A1S2VIE3_9BACT|nr:PAS domain-containing protein [Arsenicibacter rosenii]OIN58483.1 histidine kinase [Arsenicibacter rosenii]